MCNNYICIDSEILIFRLLSLKVTVVLYLMVELTCNCKPDRCVQNLVEGTVKGLLCYWSHRAKCHCGLELGLHLGFMAQGTYLPTFSQRDAHFITFLEQVIIDLQDLGELQRFACHCTWSFLIISCNGYSCNIQWQDIVFLVKNSRAVFEIFCNCYQSDNKITTIHLKHLTIPLRL